MARLTALSPTVASRQCVPVLADEIYGDMVSVTVVPCTPMLPVLSDAARSPEVSHSSTPLYCAWVNARSSQSSGVQSWEHL